MTNNLNPILLAPGLTARFSAALFDLDGVIVDTESQYTDIWEKLFGEFLGEGRDLAIKIKGQTLVQIYDAYFSGDKEALRPMVKQRLDEYEAQMHYPYIAGAEEYVKALKANGIKTAVVTSSNLAKMANVYKAHPELQAMFDAILTSEDFERSKPDPDCYLKAAARLQCPVDECIVYEDSFNGIKAGKDASMKVIGLATTNPTAAISPLCDLVVKDFTVQG